MRRERWREGEGERIGEKGKKEERIEKGGEG